MLLQKIPTPLAAILTAIVSTLSPNSIYAADAELESIVINATRFPTRLENAPGQIEVLTAKDLSKRHTERISDAINLLPGIHVQTGRGVVQPGQSIAVRGIPDGQRMLALLDGIPLNDGYSGSLNFGGLPVDAIDRIEVLYGPMSSLYGGNAMSGVVSYTTRMPAKTEFSMNVGYGNPFTAGKAPENLRKTSLSAGTRFDNDLSILAGGHWKATDGYRTELVTTSATSTAPAAGLTGWSSLVQKTGAPGYLLGNKGNTNWTENDEYLKLEQRLSDGSRWRFGWQRQNYAYASIDPQTYLRNASGAPVWACCGNITSASFLNGAGAYERNTYQAGYDTEIADGLLKITAAFSEVATNSFITPTTGTTNGGAGRISDSPAQSRWLDAFWNRQFGIHGLTVGGSWRADRADNKEFNLSDWRSASSKTTLYANVVGRSSTTAIYAQDEWQVAPDLTAHLGLRYDRWENTNGSIQTPGWTGVKIFRDYSARSEKAWSPKVALHYRLDPAIAVRSSLGSAFRAPSLYELYRSGKIGSTTYLANPDLKPETVQTWDIGTDIKPWLGAEIKLTLFANRMRDLIYTQGGSSTTKNRINAELAESEGITSAFAQQLTAATRVFASMTFTKSSVKKSTAAPDAEGKQLTFVPEKQASLGMDSSFGAWTLGMTARYASKQYAADDNTDRAANVPAVYDAYVTADAKASYKLDRNFTAALSIDNLFDREYFSFYPAPRRSWFAELSYKY